MSSTAAPAPGVTAAAPVTSSITDQQLTQATLLTPSIQPNSSSSTLQPTQATLPQAITPPIPIGTVMGQSSQPITPPMSPAKPKNPLPPGEKLLAGINLT